MNIKINLFALALVVTLTPTLWSCATVDSKSNSANSPNSIETRQLEAQGAAESPKSEDVHKLISDLNGRIQILETKLVGINDKVEATRHTLEKRGLENPNGDPKDDSTEVITHPSSNTGAALETTPSRHDPELGFVNDLGVQGFRKGMILFQGQKYQDSVLAFTSFLEKYPDHPLAGAAQFYIGEAYVEQKEYRLAVQEFQRVLTSYDRSSHISNTLGELAFAESALKQHNEAAKHRQLLASLFPQSPATLSEHQLSMSATSPAAPPLTEALAAEPGHSEAVHSEPAHSEPGHSEPGQPPVVPATAPIEESSH